MGTTYQGTLGVFIRLRQDVNWAQIKERRAPPCRRAAARSPAGEHSMTAFAASLFLLKLRLTPLVAGY